MISSHVFTGALYDFKPHLPANHIALAIGHLKNKWVHVSTSLSHKGQGLSLDPNLNIKFSLVGSEFDPILQSSIFTLSGAFKLQIFCQGTESETELELSSCSAQYADFTKNTPLESSTQISSSVFGLKGIGILKMAWADSGSNNYYSIVPFQQ